MENVVFRYSISFLEKINDTIGKTIAWCTVGMVVLAFATVMLRYIWHMHTTFIAELVRALHNVVFMVGSAYALLHDKQVRVDIFYTHFSSRTKAWVDLLGTLLLLFPFCASVWFFSWQFVLKSWRLVEKSQEVGGIPGVFLVKTCLWIWAALLLVQGMAMVCRACCLLWGKAEA